MALTVPLLSEVDFDHRAPDGFPAACPTLDLTATWESGGKHLLIVRPPGQIVSKIHQLGQPGQKAPDVLTVRWKPDGQFLAVGWSDGVVRLMGLESNKAAHHIKVCEASQAKIAHIAWASCHSSSQRFKAQQEIMSGVAEEFGRRNDGADLDLPQELTFMEVDTALPKISPLPSASAGAGEDASVFTLRSGIEFLFQPPKQEDYECVNAMIVGTDDGNLQLSIYDSFIIGSFPCPRLNDEKPPQMLLHASHPSISTHILALASEQKEPKEVHLVPMDLAFISSAPINMSLLASKLTTLQKLLRYLKQTQLHMQVEWKNTRELPSRFLRSVEGDLENMESGPRNVVAALYHTVLTGHAHEPVREWLVDSLAERGHKRWDKAVVSGLENLRGLVHENFLPALDRCSIILSRLRGLAHFYDTRDDIGFSVVQINRVMDIIASLTLVGHKILNTVMDELENFTAFSTWLRFQIDRLATPGSAGEELSEKEATLDVGKVLAYIEQYLTASPMAIFFDEISPDEQKSDWDRLEDGRSLLDLLDQQLRRHEEGQSGMRALPHVEFLVDYATARSSKIFEGIAEAQKRRVRFGKGMNLSTGQPIGNIDLRMRDDGEEGAVIFAALGSRTTGHEVHLFRAGIKVVNGISTNMSVAVCVLDTGQRSIIDFKFLDASKIVLLCSEKDGTTIIVCVPVDSGKLTYGPYEPCAAASGLRIKVEGFTEYKLPEEQSIRPVRMEVHEAKDVRGETPARISLLGRNRTALRTFILPKKGDPQ